MNKQPICVICQKPYTRRSGRQLTCGPECSRERKRIIQQEIDYEYNRTVRPGRRARLARGME